MNVFPIALLTTLAWAANGHAQEEQSQLPHPTPQIMQSQSQQPVSMESLLETLAQQQVVFLGEQHDNDSGHEFQLQVIQGLVDRGADVVVSMEQFERDVQGVVDDYLSGRINEQSFKQHSRPWRNYDQHYRPILELAKSKQVPVIAGNVPRRLANDASMQRPVRQTDQVYLPRATTAPRDGYWERFNESMKGHGGTEDQDKMFHFYAAQCLKDDAMAEAIADYLDVNPHQPKIVVHLCGHFHSDYGLGTVVRLLQRKPLLKTCVVTMESLPEDGQPDMAEVGPRGHYVFWSIKNKKSQVD